MSAAAVRGAWADAIEHDRILTFVLPFPIPGPYTAALSHQSQKLSAPTGRDTQYAQQ